MIQAQLPTTVLGAPEACYEVSIDSADDGINADDLFPERVRIHSVPFALLSADSESLGGVSASSFVQDGWSLSGNSSVGAGFLGTTDDEPLELRANNLAALRIIPNASGPNFIAGDASNNVASGGRGNGAEGVSASVGGGEENTADGNYATIGGGQNNSTSIP